MAHREFQLCLFIVFAAVLSVVVWTSFAGKNRTIELSGNEIFSLCNAGESPDRLRSSKQVKGVK